MNTPHFRQPWRRQNSVPNHTRNRNCKQKFAEKPYNGNSQNTSQSQDSTKPLKIITHPKASKDIAYKKLWAWDDYDRRDRSKKGKFVCFKCLGYLNPRDKFCSDCWSDNDWIFTWLKSLKPPYEEMKECADAEGSQSSVDSRVASEDSENVGDGLVITTREELEDSEDGNYDSISQRYGNNRDQIMISEYRRKRAVWRHVPIVVNLPKEAPRGWSAIECGMY
ncbi:hypothetical protein ONS95_014477 [Cadophora gregata]|uniref:uncharacterized protein n=1 Tax=Cadophora gregata TaxID=51156 RepID=UPI0026DDB290|nr:uncharacterized protein ONS95_014477 [Cadophora gregata]KAK0112742.1 hypothetical protein ONS95_014477 [Cadophora gregata]KAK0124877.1 hypothetical protein ONS96_008755 [Cadophora gregata f. sp. sojae]